MWSRPLVCLAMLVWSSACSGGAGAPPDVPAGLLDDAQARARGAALFATHCALCHGAEGDGRGVRRSDLSGPARNLTDPSWRSGTSAARVFTVLRDGVPGSSMPSWRALDEGARWDLTAYVLGLADQED